MTSAQEELGKVSIFWEVLGAISFEKKEFESKESCKVTGEFVNKKALVHKKVFESRKGDDG